MSSEPHTTLFSPDIQLRRSKLSLCGVIFSSRTEFYRVSGFIALKKCICEHWPLGVREQAFSGYNLFLMPEGILHHEIFSGRGTFSSSVPLKNTRAQSAQEEIYIWSHSLWMEPGRTNVFIGVMEWAPLLRGAHCFSLRARKFSDSTQTFIYISICREWARIWQGRLRYNSVLRHNQ